MILKAYSLCSVPWLSFLLKAKWGFQEVGPLKCANSTKRSPFVLHQIKFEAGTSVEPTFSFSSRISYENEQINLKDDSVRGDNSHICEVLIAFLQNSNVVI